MSDFPSEEAVLEPKRIQVFGILHVVFGGLGLLNIAGGMVWLPIQKMMLTKQIAAAKTEEEKIILELQASVYETIGAYNWISWALTAVVASLILAAGITLLKRKNIGLKLSNAYACCSILAKLAGVAVFFMILKPGIAKVMDEKFGELGVDAETMLQVMNVIMGIAGVLGPVLGMIYPILCLTMLNKDMVRQHLK